MTTPSLDVPASLRGRGRIVANIEAQQRWIEYCENGRSYKGPNGQAIREADAWILNRWEKLLRDFDKFKEILNS
jgi:hypothetical protein